MAENKNDRRIECSVSGVPFNMPDPADYPISKQGGPGTDYIRPTKAAKNANPESITGVRLLRWGDSKTSAGKAWRDENGKWVAAIHGKLPIAFDTAEERREYFRQSNVEPFAEAHDVVPSNYTLNFGTTNEFAVAPDWLRQAAMYLARLDSNTWTMAQTTRAVNQRAEMAQLGRWDRMVARWNTSNADMDEMLRQMPEWRLDQTLAGRALNAGRWVRQNVLDNISVVDDPTIRGDRAPVREQLERMRGEMNQAINGEQSPVKTMRRQVSDLLKRLSITAEEMGRYRMALHTPERIKQVNAQYRSLFEKDMEKANDYYMNRDDPLFFRHTVTRDGKQVELKGQEAATAYLESLSPAKRQRLDFINNLLSGYIMQQLEHRVRSGVGMTMEDFEDFKRNTPNYIPVREEDGPGFLGAKSPVSLRGRSSAAENPERQIFEWLDGQTRAVWLNDYRRSFVDAIRDNPAQKVLSFEMKKAVRSRDGLRWELPKNEEPNTAYIWYPPEEPGGPPMLAHVTIDTSGSRGKVLAGILTNQNKEAVIAHIAGTTRFMSWMMTTAQPAWALKNLAWNTVITPFALQSAGDLSFREATGLLWGQGGVGPYFRNVVSLFKSGVRGKEDWRLSMARELGAGSLSEGRFDATKLGRQWDYDSGKIADRLRAAPGQTLLEGSARALNGMLHISHTPDLAFQYGTFWTLLEHYAGKTFGNAEEARAWMGANQNLVTKALNGSRRVLPNFANQGNLRLLSAFFPFFNATVQTAPFMRQMATSGYGQLGFGLALVLGYASKELAYQEFGDQADTMRGEEGSLYLGGGFAWPMDYAFHLPMAIGSGMSSVMRGRQDASEYLKDVGRAAVSSFSPIDLPWKTQSWGAWAQQVITPPVLQAPVMVMSGTDQNGHPLYNENPTDAQGHRLLNAEGWQMGRPQDSVWSTQLARGVSAMTGNLINLAPGQVSTLVHSYAPVVSNIADATEGQRTVSAGGDPNILTGVRDAVAPNFTSSPTYSGEQARFMSAYRTLVGPNASSQSLLAGQYGDNGRRAEMLRAQASHLANNIRIGGMTGPDLRAQIVDAQQRRDYTTATRLQNLEHAMREQKNAVWDKYAEEIEELQNGR